MSENISATFTFGYSNTDFTRKYKFDGLSTGDLSSLKSNVLALNASLAAGTDGGLSSFFLSDDFDNSDATAVVGYFTGVTALQSTSQATTDIDLN